MKKYLIMMLWMTSALFFLTAAMGSENEFFSRDPNATYNENYPELNLVIEVPGQKLDPKSALAIPVKDAEYESARQIDPAILDKAKRYVEYKKLNFTDDYKLYAAKDLGGYILLYFQEGNSKDGETVFVSDGGFELIYSNELKKIIGTFSAGYKG